MGFNLKIILHSSTKEHVIIAQIKTNQKTINISIENLLLN